MTMTPEQISEARAIVEAHDAAARAQGLADLQALFATPGYAEVREALRAASALLEREPQMMVDLRQIPGALDRAEATLVRLLPAAIAD